jgi:hypothetical protein
VNVEKCQTSVIVKSKPPMIINAPPIIESISESETLFDAPTLSTLCIF